MPRHPSTTTACSHQSLPFDSPVLFKLLQEMVTESLLGLGHQTRAQGKASARDFAVDLVEQHGLYLLACQSSEVARNWPDDISRNEWLDRVFSTISKEKNRHPLYEGILERRKLAGGDIKSALIGVVETAYGKLAGNNHERIMSSPRASAPLKERQAYRDLVMAVAHAAAEELCHRHYQCGLPPLIPGKIDGSRLDLSL